MQTKLNKSNKIILDTRHENKARNRNKTLTNSKESCEQVAPLKTTPHNESNKIWFGIFRAIHK